MSVLLNIIVVLSLNSPPTRGMEVEGAESRNLSSQAQITKCSQPTSYAERGEEENTPEKKRQIKDTVNNINYN